VEPDFEFRLTVHGNSADKRRGTVGENLATSQKSASSPVIVIDVEKKERSLNSSVLFPVLCATVWKFQM
jgi:hypothetical protein